MILVATGAIGVLAVLAGWRARHAMFSPKGVPTAVLSPEKVLELGELARGPMSEVPYMANDMARVATYAVAKRAGDKWDGLPAGTILQVTGTDIKEGETWVIGRVQGGVRSENVVVHGSFLERYLPVVLDKTMELSDVRLVHVSEMPPQMSVTGWLRNITSQTISQCVVTCVFQDQNGREVDAQRTGDLVLPPLELIRFETGVTGTEKSFKSFSIQITHATPDGLRNYLSTIVIQRSTMH